MVEPTADKGEVTGSNPVAPTIMKVCKKHGLTSHALDVRGYHRCRPCRVEHVDRRRKLVKQKAVDYLGEKCQRCGYDRYIGALEFHHRDPNEKDFQIAASLSWDKIVKELNKCDLLCANCHREIHQELRNIP